MLRRKRTAQLDNVNLLDLRPVRLAEWEDDGERVVILRPRPPRRGRWHVVHVLIYHMAARRIRLDPVGSAAWRLLDGAHTVSEIAARLSSQFGERAEPADVRLGLLIRALRREELIGYPGWDDDAIRAAATR